MFGGCMTMEALHFYFPTFWQRELNFPDAAYVYSLLLINGMNWTEKQESKAFKI